MQLRQAEDTETMFSTSSANLWECLGDVIKPFTSIYRMISVTRAAEDPGLIWRQAPPALKMAMVATTAHLDFSKHKGTMTSGPILRVFRCRASDEVSLSSSAYENSPSQAQTPGKSGLSCIRISIK